MGSVKIELADAVAALRDELLAAHARGAGAEIAFDVGPIEMEFAVELRHDAKGNGGFKAWVVTAGAEASAGRTRTHRVTVTLTPRRADGRDLPIHGDPDRPQGPGDVSARIPN
ncbi:trypco2 family protein [Streptomyces sp. NPDC052773]|uniref:trypco2 family protein n=1 Tax=Streptomyces sp. NPDC052773 TaxID=3365693 RepID=UPI0037D5B0CD